MFLRAFPLLASNDRARSHGQRHSDRGLFTCAKPRGQLWVISLNRGASHRVEDNRSVVAPVERKNPRSETH